ncbi:BnaC05g08920D [Brassica napus]|uniref:(rape) hypothetical protein n=1 Tax=Brassica napus TaxID=3708 RepID=A0A078G3U8_BRANA|nr:heavy metal-associated isoprenylated plant protein 19 [Brassica napus]XP_013693805.1 heavy metal-associated isoprenylated plant protein 19 [Brassica napus]XP_048613961.1 heavy metal-associated isoprenylated plant protein 19 [Brassica napus]CAF1925018.1 unnamed protein product [Brassica napus]CDY19383.1 BnaC05g08920D [Brassica napus]
MTKEKKKDNVRYMNVEFNVSMHCNECERKIARVISKFKGVETFTTDMNSHKVVVTGRLDPKKLLKKLKKKTGKRVKIVAKDVTNRLSQKPSNSCKADAFASLFAGSLRRLVYML